MTPEEVTKFETELQDVIERFETQTGFEVWNVTLASRTNQKRVSLSLKTLPKSEAQTA